MEKVWECKLIQPLWRSLSCVSHSVLSNSYYSMDCSPAVHGILQATVLEWLAIASPGDLPNPGIEPGSPAFRQMLY